MPEPANLQTDTILRNYFRAKDENRPHWMQRAFSPDARLEIRNHSSAIAFPSETFGRAGIEDVLARQFGQSYENVYTFYLSRPAGMLKRYTCDWLVAMTEKSTHAVRVGCGRYDWTFTDTPPFLASELIITIGAMSLLPPSAMTLVYDWVAGLSYPWSSHDEIRAHLPHLPELAAMIETLDALRHVQDSD